MDHTRYGRVLESVESSRSTEGTRVLTSRRPAAASVRELFSHRQRMMASAVREEARPGLFVFCAHREFGHVGRLWLEAGTEPRAGVLGRHDGVDLALPLDEALSLRHVLFVVRRRAGEVTFEALDLATSNGVSLEDERPRRLVRGRGPLILAASEFVFFCVPTGGALPWDPDAQTPWDTLAPRVDLPRTTGLMARFRRGPVGHLELDGRRFALPGEDLHRGVLIGRSDRCDVLVPEDEISRVHAVLLRVDDETWLFDAGSTNGLWRGDDEVKRVRLADGDEVGLGPRATLTWRAVQ